jgi:LysW-gamma-L-lysine carboxypeptidase
MDAMTLLREMVAIKSHSGEEAEVARYVVGCMSELGFDAHVDEAGNAVGTRRGSAAADGGRELVLLGHIDTVPGDVPHKLEGDLLYGRGSVDAKGPLATFVMAVAEAELAPDVTLTVVGAVEEECATSKGARHRAPLHRPEACIIGEPSGWDACTLGYKGRMLLDARAEQPGGHSAGPQGGVGEMGVLLWNRLSALADEYNAERPKLFEQLMLSLRNFVTSSDGLTDVVEMTLGFRLPPDYDTELAKACAREALPDASLSFYGEEVAWSSARTSPLARAFSRSFAAHDLKPRFKHKTGTSDMNVLGPVWGCPIIAYGPGDSLLDHTPNEHISIDEYRRAIGVLGTVLVEGGWATRH